MIIFLIFEIQILLTTSDGEMIKIKVVDLKMVYIFVVDHFSFEFVQGANTHFKTRWTYNREDENPKCTLVSYEWSGQVTNTRGA